MGKLFYGKEFYSAATYLSTLASQKLQVIGAVYITLISITYGALSDKYRVKLNCNVVISPIFIHRISCG